MNMATIVLASDGLLGVRFPRYAGRTVGGSNSPRTWLKRFIRTVKEFRANPVFAVEDGRLVFRCGRETYKMAPEFLGINSEPLPDGRQVRVDVESFKARSAKVTLTAAVQQIAVAV